MNGIGKSLLIRTIFDQLKQEYLDTSAKKVVITRTSQPEKKDIIPLILAFGINGVQRGCLAEETNEEAHDQSVNNISRKIENNSRKIEVDTPYIIDSNAYYFIECVTKNYVVKTNDENNKRIVVIRYLLKIMSEENDKISLLEYLKRQELIDVNEEQKLRKKNNLELKSLKPEELKDNPIESDLRYRCIRYFRGMDPKHIYCEYSILSFLIYLKLITKDEFNKFLDENEFEYNLNQDTVKIVNEQNKMNPDLIAYQESYNNTNLKFNRKADDKEVKHLELSSGEKNHFYLLLWKLINQKNKEVTETGHKGLLHHQAKYIFLLDEPDSNLHQAKINKLTEIIKDDIVDGLGIQVVHTTHNDKTVQYLDDPKNDQVACFIMSKDENNSIKMEKCTYSLASKLLLDNMYTCFLKKRITIPIFEDLIESTNSLVSNDRGIAIETLIKMYLEDNNNEILRFYEIFGISEDFLTDHSQISFQKTKNLYDTEIIISLITKIKKDKNKKVLIIWPENKQNSAFDFMVIKGSSGESSKKKVCFIQVSVRTDVTKKANETTEENKLQYYKSLIDELKNKYEIEYFLFHGNKAEKRKKITQNKTELSLFSLQYLGNKYFDSDPMKYLKKELDPLNVEFLKKVMKITKVSSKSKQTFEEIGQLNDSNEIETVYTKALKEEKDILWIWQKVENTKCHHCFNLMIILPNSKKVYIIQIAECLTETWGLVSNINKYLQLIQFLKDKELKIEYFYFHEDGNKDNFELRLKVNNDEKNKNLTKKEKKLIEEFNKNEIKCHSLEELDKAYSGSYIMNQINKIKEKKETEKK